MATRIPLPGFGTEALQKGVESGTNLWQQLLGQGVNLGKMHQAQQHHAENLLFRQEQEKRLLEELALNKQLQPLKTDKIKAEIDRLKAMTQKAQQPPTRKPTELEAIAMVLSGGDPDKYKELLAEAGATKFGLTLPGSENLPLGSQPFKSLPKNIQAQENADQIKMQAKVTDARKAYHDLDEMEALINTYPDMASDFTYILGNPEDKSFISNLYRRYADKKKLAAIEKFVKYSNDFVLSAGGGLGNNFTDAKLKALQLSKMHAGNTAEANRAIIGNYRQRLKPMINYGTELKKARGKYTLPYFEDSYTDEALGIRPIESLSDEELDALERGS